MSGQKAGSTEEKRIVVIGNGAAGSQFATKAVKNRNYHITVITPFDYSEVSLCMTKAIAVGPDEHSKALYPLLREEKVEYAIGVVDSIDGKTVVLKSGERIDFDVCVVAVGQKIPLFYPEPINDGSKEARQASISNLNSSIQRANHIVISGGGPVGTELAADIKLRNKAKQVTLIHSHPQVLERMHDPFPRLSTEHLGKIGIELYLNDRVASVDKDQQKVRLASGKTLQCDLYIPAHAVGGNAGFLPAGSKDARNYAVVDDTFAVQGGLRGVFALGDCSNYDPVKTYARIDDQLPVLLHNIDAYLHGHPLKHHVRGASFMGQVSGPLLVAFGHGLPDGYGVGPDLPGCMGGCCWFCCCFGWPCSPPAGAASAKTKSDFNYSIKPKPGIGIH